MRRVERHVGKFLEPAPPFSGHTRELSGDRHGHVCTPGLSAGGSGESAPFLRHPLRAGPN